MVGRMLQARQVEAEEVSNSRNKVHHTMYKDFFRLCTLCQESRFERSRDLALRASAFGTQAGHRW